MRLTTPSSHSLSRTCSPTAAHHPHILLGLETTPSPYRPYFLIHCFLSYRHSLQVTEASSYNAHKRLSCQFMGTHTCAHGLFIMTLSFISAVVLAMGSFSWTRTVCRIHPPKAIIYQPLSSIKKLL